MRQAQWRSRIPLLPDRRGRRRPILGSGRLLGAARLVALLFAAVIGLTLAIRPTPAVAKPVAVASDARIGQHNSVTRFVLDLSDHVSFDLFTLADPYRVVIDLPEIRWNLPAAALPARTGIFDRVRFGLFKPGTSRLVLDLNDAVVVNEAFLMKPLDDKGYRLVVDLVATDRTAFLATVRNGVPAPRAIPVAASSPPLMAFARPPPRPSTVPLQRIIVLDPGHGGADPRRHRSLRHL